MNANSTRNVVVESGGTQVVAHVGLHALGSFADRLGVGERLSSAVGWSGPGVPVHDRGRVLCQAMLMLAGGGESCTDIESLAAQGRLFGDVCSDTTLYRTFTDSLDGDTLVRARHAIGRIRGEVWERIPAVTGGDDPVILDIDASLVEIHSENKDGTAPNFKGGFGFHPMFCFADATGEALAARLRPGNAAANDAADNLEVLDDAITQLPADVAAGHCVDDGLGEVRRRVMVRSDSAGCTAGFVDGCRSRNIGFAVVARRKTAVSAAVAVANTDNDRWVPALNQDGTPAQPIHQDDGDDKVAMVCEVTDLVDLSSWPKGTRLIVRREPLHPGAQTSLLPDLEYRFWGHYTDQDGDPATLDRQMRAHAHVEDHIGRLAWVEVTARGVLLPSHRVGRTEPASRPRPHEELTGEFDNGRHLATVCGQLDTSPRQCTAYRSFVFGWLSHGGRGTTGMRWIRGTTAEQNSHTTHEKQHRTHRSHGHQPRSPYPRGPRR